MCDNDNVSGYKGVHYCLIIVEKETVSLGTNMKVNLTEIDAKFNLGMLKPATVQCVKCTLCEDKPRHCMHTGLHQVISFVYL